MSVGDVRIDLVWCCHLYFQQTASIASLCNDDLLAAGIYGTLYVAILLIPPPGLSQAARHDALMEDGGGILYILAIQALMDLEKCGGLPLIGALRQATRVTVCGDGVVFQHLPYAAWRTTLPATRLQRTCLILPFSI